MNNEDYLKNLWQNQPTIQPTIEDVFSKIAKLKNDFNKRAFALNFMLLGTIAFIVIMWKAVNHKYITTNIGMYLCIIGILVYLFFNNKSFIIFSRKANLFQPNIYLLDDLLAIQKKQFFMQTTALKIYFSLFGTGLCLYLYEYISFFSIKNQVVIYVLLIGWIAINWFYFLPKQNKKDKKKYDEILLKIEGIKKQLQ